MSEGKREAGQMEGGMKMSSGKKWKAAAAAVLALLLVLAGGWQIFRGSGTIRKEYEYSDGAFGNPLMGYAPCAWYDEVSEDITLLYMDITWRELEPEEGVFDWESIEKENQLERWKKEGKHIILRFVCDIPGDQEHMDIPDWLYEKTGGAGAEYHTSYGYGFAPDYSNEVFIACHENAVAALGRRYGKDSLVSFIELGSLGHWGEWHVKSSEGIPGMPDQDVRKEYVRHWVKAFPHTELLMRRPFAEAGEYGLGLYNDMAGDREATDEWLEWIENGGEYSQTGEKDALTAMKDFWKTAPAGGEFTSGTEMEKLLDENLSDTVSMIRDSHTTFLGPKIADREYRDGYDAVLAGMGYRIWISDMELSSGFPSGVQVKLSWRNSGTAPMYADWPVQIQVEDQDGGIVEKKTVDLFLSQLLPDSSAETETMLNSIKRWRDLKQYTISLGITDPMTGEYAVRFALKDAEQQENRLILHEAEQEEKTPDSGGKTG